MKKSLYGFTLVAFLLLLPLLTFAQIKGNPTTPTIPGKPTTPIIRGDAKGCDPEAGKICNPLDDGTSTIQGFIQKVLEGALKIGIPLIALAIIYSGFLFVKARGNAEELTKAKDALMYTLIGAAILLGAWAIAKLIAETVLGLQ